MWKKFIPIARKQMKELSDYASSKDTNATWEKICTDRGWSSEDRDSSPARFYKAALDNHRLSMRSTILQGILLFIAWPFLLAEGLQRIKPYLAYPIVKLFACLVVLAFALALYWMRQKFRMVYGLAEIFAGLTACWVMLGSLEEARLKFVLLVATSIYVMVRGFDNFFAGRAEIAKRDDSS